MSHIVRTMIGRHIGYTPEDLFDEGPGSGLPCEESGTGTGTRPLSRARNGIPIIVKMPSAFCADPGQQPEIMGMRHVGFSPLGAPVLSYGFTCCDAVPRDDDPEPYVEIPCHGGIGITRKAYAYLTNVSNCVSAIGKKAELIYDDPDLGGDGKWKGSVELRAGTLHLAFSCVGSGSYLLEWWGCEPECDDPTKATGTGSVVCSFQTAAECDTPLVVNFGNITLDDCCDCVLENTTVAAEINLYVVANCNRVVVCRHVDYNRGSTSTGVPIVAFERDCGYQVHTNAGCSDVECGLFMTVTGEGDCDCLDCAIIFPYLAGTWQVACGNCPEAADYTMSCHDNCDGTSTYTLNVVCGATNTGSGTVTIPKEDIEDLDITFNISLVDPAAGSCTGTCIYQFTMAGWTLESHTCSIGCEDCGEEPSDPTPEEVLAGTATRSCTGGGTPAPCCIGNIEVRVMR